MTAIAKLRQHWPGVILFCVSLLIGILSYQDYGMSWDEPAQQGLGRINYAYIFDGNNTLRTYNDRAYGAGFELPLICIEKWAHIVHSRDVYLFRHIATHLFFLLGVFCGYILAYRLFKDRLIAILAFIMLAFHPRIYAHSYFNTKDVPLLSALLIVMLVADIAFKKDKWPWYVLLGVACGYATSIRLIGILFLLLLSLFFFIDLVRKITQSEKAWPVILNWTVFAFGFCGMLCAAWPLLWSHPVSNFFESYQNLSHIGWNGQVLFDGKMYAGNMLPLQYMPVWFSITMPELWLATGLAGIVWVMALFIKRPAHFLAPTPERNFLFYITCFAIPVIAITLLHGVNIDDWRHLYFIYPPFVFLALFTIHKLAKGRWKPLVIAACSLQIVLIAFFMIRYHPYQQVYFNNLISHRKEYLRKNYDLEYWGCAYKEGMDYIISHDTSPVIRVSASEPERNAVAMLPERDKERIISVAESEHPDYFITNFRMHPDDYNYPIVFYEVRVLNSTIMRVYKLK
jgi:hypothetical protein